MSTKETKHWSTSTTVFTALIVMAFFIAVVLLAGAFPQYIPASIKDTAVGGVLAGIITVASRVFGVGAKDKLYFRKKMTD